MRLKDNKQSTCEEDNRQKSASVTTSHNNKSLLRFWTWSSTSASSEEEHYSQPDQQTKKEMAKKKKQNTNKKGTKLNGKARITSESENEEKAVIEAESADSEVVNGGGKVCDHYKKAIQIKLIRKKLKNRSVGMCDECAEDESLTWAADQAIWLCLACGVQGCGRDSTAQHALLHSQVSRSSPHCLAVRIPGFMLWCYQCDEELPPESIDKCGFLTHNLNTLKTILLKPKEQQRKPSICCTAEDSKESVKMEGKPLPQSCELVPEKEIKKKEQKRVPDLCKIDVPVPKGLNNLGNTCFFNSVMQSLAQTHQLGHALRQTSSSVSTALCVSPVSPLTTDCPVRDFNDNEQDTSQLGTINLTLEPDSGPLTQSFTKFLGEFHHISGSKSLSPSVLFGNVCRKAPRFKGFRQQDSHELLRHLLDGLRAEETKRIQNAICRALDIPESANRAKVDDSKANVARAYNKAAANLTAVDRVFGGDLLQSIQCLRPGCGYISQKLEPFLDLSLPIVDTKELNKQSQSIAVNGGDESSLLKSKDKKKNKKSVSFASDSDGDLDSLLADNKQGKKSKHQMKKEAKERKKNTKKCKTGDAKDGEEIATEAKEDSISETTTNSTTDNRDAAVETLAQDLGDNLHISQDDNNQPMSNGVEVTTSDNSDFQRSRAGAGGCRGSKKAKEAGLCNGHDESSESDADVISTKGECRSTFVSETIDSTAAKVEGDSERPSSTNGRPTTNKGDSENETNDEEEGDDVMAERMLRLASVDTQRWSSSCNLGSCLKNFTAEENLCGRNQFGCVRCARLFPHLIKPEPTSTKKSSAPTKKSSEQPKTVLSDARKNYLIFNPPAVLTLHLKRFYQTGFMTRKLSKHVEFAPLLDLAHFTSKQGKRLRKGQNRVLYSLYGVVTHWGGLSSGHYVAYVKVRERDDRLLSAFLSAQSSRNDKAQPTNAAKLSHSMGEESDGDCGSPSGAMVPPEGRWFYISDKQVTEVSIGDVLKSEAYILFYERIL